MKTSPVKLWRRHKSVSNLIGQKGKILQWTMIRVAAKAFVDQVPYPVVIVEFEDGERTIGQLVDYSDAQLKQGQKVEAVLRRLRTEGKEDAIYYHIKFKPV
jgi:uncharacterized protein